LSFLASVKRHIMSSGSSVVDLVASSSPLGVPSPPRTQGSKVGTWIPGQPRPHLSSRDPWFGAPWEKRPHPDVANGGVFCLPKSVWPEWSEVGILQRPTGEFHLHLMIVLCHHLSTQQCLLQATRALRGSCATGVVTFSQVAQSALGVTSAL
jgi:hypothetical protein